MKYENIKISTIFIVYISIMLVCILFMMINLDYFQEAVYSYPLSENYPLISKIIGGDSINYYKINNNLNDLIISGYYEDTVHLGSIFSLVGINLLMQILGEIPIPIYLTWIIFSITVTYLAVNLGGDKKLNEIQFKSLCIYPLLVIYFLMPNKEIFSVLLLLIIPKIKNITAIIILSFIFGLMREIYFVIILLYVISRFIKSNLIFYCLVYISSIFTAMLLPESYMEDTYISDAQESSYITEFAIELLNTKILAIFGLFVKAALGIIGPIVSGYKNFLAGNIIGMIYFISAIIFLLSLINLINKFFLSGNFLKNYCSISINNELFRLSILYLIFMSFAPGNPARLIMPSLIPILILNKMKVIDYENNDNRLQKS